MTELAKTTLEKIDSLSESISSNLSCDIVRMSSKEISEICEKEHKHIIRDIKKMLQDLGLIDGPNLDHYNYNNNKEIYHEIF